MAALLFTTKIYIAICKADPPLMGLPTVLLNLADIIRQSGDLHVRVPLHHFLPPRADQMPGSEGQDHCVRPYIL